MEVNKWKETNGSKQMEVNKWKETNASQQQGRKTQGINQREIVFTLNLHVLHLSYS